MDDAGVYKISDDLAMVQTVDFFFPAVNDPRDFGRIVAANSLSDIWAMGAKPVTAMNVLAYPAGKVPIEAIEELLIGGSEKLKEAEVCLVGGHTLEQEVFVYGMSVTGTIHPKDLKTNHTARVGDVLILTKPIGTGVMSSAVEQDGLTDQQYKEFVESMYRLNKYAFESIAPFDLSALTDVTGFGLLGHAYTMAKTSNVNIQFEVEKIPFFTDLFAITEQFSPKGIGKTIEYIETNTYVHENTNEEKVKLLSEAQTSGGLLAAVHPKDAERALQVLHNNGDTTSAIIGEVLARKRGEEDYYLTVT